MEITFNLGAAIRSEPVQRSSMVLYDLEESSLTESCVKCKIAHYINEQDELAFLRESSISLSQFNPFIYRQLISNFFSTSRHEPQDAQVYANADAL